MAKLANSVLSYGLATALYAGQTTAKVLGLPSKLVNPKNPPGPGPEGEPPNTFNGKIYKSTKKTVEKFGDPAAVAFIAGDEYLSKASDLVFNMFGGTHPEPSFRPGLIGSLAEQSSLALAAVGTKRSLYAQQAENTRYIFVLVRNNPEELGIPKSGMFDLSFFMEKAYGIGDYENIWSVEGLGHVYCQRVWDLKWNCSEDATGILMDDQAAHMPVKSLTMMHAGLGLMLAESLLKQLTPDSSHKEVARVLRSFIKLCENNSREGYVGCALESLGLVTRCFNFPLVSLVQHVLADVDPIAWEFFWRGAGRALYFSPAHMVQPLYSPWIAAEQEAPNERAWKILKAGISWPTNIVNMRHPAIFEDLIKLRGAAEENQYTIAHGVAASTTMAMDITPHHPLVKEYLAYVPQSTDTKVRDLWKKLVHDQVDKAMHVYQPLFHKHKMMDQVFRVQDLDALAAKLTAKESNGHHEHAHETHAKEGAHSHEAKKHKA
jgi:hypothetical protein